MSRLRQEPISGRWVIIAPQRAGRPYEFTAMHQSGESFDPFLEGNEHATPGEILAIRRPGTQPDRPGWRVRVVPNKFPALVMEGASNRLNGSPADGCHAGENLEVDLYQEVHGHGAHEVVIECPHGESSLAGLPQEQFVDVLRAYRERLRSLSNDSELAWAMVFKNHGPGGGASLGHSHSQIIALPIVPPEIQRSIDRARDHFELRGSCLVCELIESERACSDRLVAEIGSFLAFCPFASRFPYETWLVPTRHGGRFESLDEAVLDEFGMALKTVLGKLHAALDDPPYNSVLHTAPFRLGETPWLHWRLEVLPRLTGVAGFEWGSGCFINPVPPEAAAARLRQTTHS